MILALFSASMPVRAEEKTILFLGDSLTAGYSIAKEDAYPALIEKKAGQTDIQIKVINAGVSGDTSGGGLERLDWYLKEKIDVLFLALGANDGLRGLPVDHLKTNLRKIIDQTRERYPDIKIVLAGMRLPLNFGPAYTSEFENSFPAVAKEKQVVLMPFLLEGVAGEKDLNLPDKLHPSPAGHLVMAEKVWAVIRPLL